MNKYFLFALLCVLSIAAFASGLNVDTSNANQISIMTYNIKMLPKGAVFLHHHPVKRARLIPEKILAESPDVIVFEEAFDVVSMHIIKKKLKAVYPYTMGQQNRKIMNYKRAGGVFMFSKYPMKELESVKYSQCKGIDCIGNKGAMLVEVMHPLHKFQIFGTHMQAGGSRDLKLSQYAEAGELLKRHEEQGIPQFVSGDFNTVKDNLELYPYLMKALNAEDGELTGELQYTSDHLLNDLENYNPNKRRVIDYVFIKANGFKPASTMRYAREFQQRWSSKHKDLSDHNALVLKVKL